MLFSLIRLNVNLTIWDFVGLTIWGVVGSIGILLTAGIKFKPVITNSSPNATFSPKEKSEKCTGVS